MTSRNHTVLLLIDIQPDFMPGGGLAVEGGDQIVAPVRALMESNRFDLCVATQDWHPADHISFASNHPNAQAMDSIDLYGHEQTLWPDHCVQGTRGAQLHEGLALDRIEAVIRKGTDPKVDSYSGFRNNWNAAGERPATGLGGYLRERGVQKVVICGLARDVCVKFSAIDAAEAGFHTTVLWDLTRPVDPATDTAVRRDLQERGVMVIDTEQ